MSETFRPDVDTLEILSLGAGKNSSVLLLASLIGELPRLDAAIFADTFREPPEVYAQVWWLAEKCAEAEPPLDLFIVAYGDLEEFALDVESRSGTIPVFIKNADGSQGKLRRQCTADFKVEVVTKELERLRSGRPVRQWMGMCLDEVHRMKTNRKNWITNVYPLIYGMHLRRDDCDRWLSERGWSAPRSACYFCPFKRDSEWRRLRDDTPELFAKAAKFESDLQAAHRDSGSPKALRGTPFLHRSMLPLLQVDFSTPEDHGQGSFDEECEGYCGV